MNGTVPRTSSQADEHRTWVFQANPKYFDLIDALKKKKTIRWSVAQYKEEIHSGDTVYLWLSGADGGLLARGIATTEPSLLEDMEEEEDAELVDEQDVDDGNQEDEDPNQLWVDIRIEEIFAKPLTRQDCLNHPILRSMTIIRIPRGTNFKVSPEEAAALAEVTGIGGLAAEFAKFREDPYNRFVVQLRRKHAGQLRQLLSEPDKITLDWFNKEVWWIESSTRLGNEETKVYTSVPPDASRVAELQLALDEDRLELHGNYIWGSAAHIYGSGLKTGGDQKVENILKALGILNDHKLTPLQKAEQIRSVPGFGDNTATGVVMVFHPNGFAISNKQSNEALEKLGMKAGSLSEFQDKVKSLQEELGADDYLELDWFLFLLNQGKYKPAGHAPISKPSTVKSDARYWVMSLGEGARLWEQCRTEGIVALGWDYLGDLSQYPSKEAIAAALSKQRDDDTYPTNDALACYQWAQPVFRDVSASIASTYVWARI